MENLIVMFFYYYQLRSIISEKEFSWILIHADNSWPSFVVYITLNTVTLLHRAIKFQVLQEFSNIPDRPWKYRDQARFAVKAVAVIVLECVAFLRHFRGNKKSLYLVNPCLP